MLCKCRSCLKAGLTPLIALANSSQVGGGTMKAMERHLSRRDLLGTLGVAGAGIVGSRWLAPDVAIAQEPGRGKAIETFTGPGANPHWNSVGSYMTEPQKITLILLTDRTVPLEMPSPCYSTAFYTNVHIYL